MVSALPRCAVPGDPMLDLPMPTPPATRRYTLACALFPRLLALVYLSAFASTALQLPGLVGPSGILPVGEALAAAEAGLGRAAYWQVPTLAWLGASDAALTTTALAGCAVAGLMLLNVLPRLSALAAFGLYLSLFHAGQVFMNFQWDYLLLESGFLAVFLPGRTPLVVWLYRWLLFRLRFLSGIGKLLSQDPSWIGLTAVGYFLETQPLPHWGAWYAHLLPQTVLQAATAAVLLIELAVPLTGFMPRRLRLSGAWATLAMQVAILASANHNYANLLTIALCLFLFDDQALGRLLPAGLARRLAGRAAPAPIDTGIERAEGTAGSRQAAGTSTRSGRGLCLVEGRIAVPVVAGVVLVVSGLQMGEMLSGRPASGPAATLLQALRPLRLVSRYHAFPTMKTERIEIEIEGSRDGETWRPYAFR